MLILLLKEIVDSSETAIDHLVAQTKSLKISSIQGEDVNEIVSSLRAVHQTFEMRPSQSFSFAQDKTSLYMALARSDFSVYSSEEI